MKSVYKKEDVKRSQYIKKKTFKEVSKLINICNVII